jgi:hypothetical protein
MRRLLLSAVLATACFGFAPSSDAVCAGTVVCGVSGCTGLVNACPTATSCAGGVSVCPWAEPDDCRSSVDVCLGIRSAVACQPVTCR